MSETRRKLLSDKVRRYYACVDMNDIDGVLDLFSLDATYERPGYPTIVGRECLERFYSEERTIRNGQHTVVDLIAVDNRAAVHGYFAGTLKSGKSVELRFADFFIAADDGAFTRRDTFFFAPMV